MQRMRRPLVRIACSAPVREPVPTAAEGAGHPASGRPEVAIRYRVVGSARHFSVTKDGRVAWNGFAAVDDREAQRKVEKRMLDFAGDILWPVKLRPQ